MMSARIVSDLRKSAGTRQLQQMPYRSIHLLTRGPVIANGKLCGIECLCRSVGRSMYGVKCSCTCFFPLLAFF